MRQSAIFAGAALILGAAGAQAHECYRRVVEPPRYSVVSEEVLVSAAREVAEYVPAVTREVEEQVIVRPAETVARVIPAQYAVEEETVEVAPPHREWRVRDESGDVIGCWINVPARYGRVARRVMVSPAREIEETIPAEYGTRLRTVVVEPAHEIVHTIPARYGTREREVMESAGGAHWSPINGCE